MLCPAERVPSEPGQREEVCYLLETSSRRKESLLTGPRILIILSLDVLKEHGKREKIGNPVSLEQEIACGSTTAPIQPQQASATSFYGNKPGAAAVPARAPAQKPKYVFSSLELVNNF